MATFEVQEDRDREIKAIELLCSIYEVDYIKLPSADVDFQLINKRGMVIAYVEVKGRNRTIERAFDLPIAVRKIIKLTNYAIKPIVVWACFDGIIYADINKLVGTIRLGGRPKREGAYNDCEIMAYYNRQENINIIKQ